MFDPPDAVFLQFCIRYYSNSVFEIFCGRLLTVKNIRTIFTFAQNVIHNNNTTTLAKTSRGDSGEVCSVRTFPKSHNSQPSGFAPSNPAPSLSSARRSRERTERIKSCDKWTDPDVARHFDIRYWQRGKLLFLSHGYGLGCRKRGIKQGKIQEITKT